MKVVPLLTSLSTLTDPPISSTSDLHILKPNPVPNLLPDACSSSFPKFINSFGKFSGDIPYPESSILSSNLMYFSIFYKFLAFWEIDLLFFGVSDKFSNMISGPIRTTSTFYSSLERDYPGTMRRESSLLFWGFTIWVN